MTDLTINLEVFVISLEWNAIEEINCRDKP